MAVKLCINIHHYLSHQFSLSISYIGSEAVSVIWHFFVVFLFVDPSLRTLSIQKGKIGKIRNFLGNR